MDKNKILQIINDVKKNVTVLFKIVKYFNRSQLKDVNKMNRMLLSFKANTSKISMIVNKFLTQYKMLAGMRVVSMNKFEAFRTALSGAVNEIKSLTSRYTKCDGSKQCIRAILLIFKAIKDIAKKGKSWLLIPAKRGLRGLK